MDRDNSTFDFLQTDENKTVFQMLSSKMDGGDETKLTVFAGYTIILTITFCLAKTWDFLPRLAYLFAFLLSWLVGYIVRHWTPYYHDKLVRACFSKVELSMIIPFLIFHYTLRIDYYTLGRILGPVVFVSCSLFAANVGILSIVMYSISERGTPYSPKLLHALTLSIISASHAVNMLERVRGRVRQLQILLQGEILISLALFCYLYDVVLKCFDFNQLDTGEASTPWGAHQKIIFLVWHAVGILPGLLAAYLFKQFVRQAYDDCAGQGICCITCIVVTYCLCEIWGICGSLAVLAYGVSLGTSKIKFNKRTARFYYDSDRAITFLTSSVIFVYCGFYIGLTHTGYEYYQASYVFIVFATCMTTRVITFVLIHRMIGMLNQITWRHLTVGVQGASRGALLLAFSLNFIVTYDLHEGKKMLIDNVILVCYSYVFNIALLGPVLEAMGMNDLTRPKIINMNWALSLVNICRSRAIESLQVDRVIADANWVVVDQSTILRHPYKHSKKRSIQASYKDFEEEFDAKGRIISCVNCGAKGVAPLSKREMEDESSDIKHRILKAQQVSFHRQHENGTLSRHGLKVLSNHVEKVLFRDDLILAAKDLNLQREGSPKLIRLKRLFRRWLSVASKEHEFIPTSWLRAICFRICTLRTYQLVMALLTVLDLILLVVMLQKYYSNAPAGQSVQFLQATDFLFCVIFVFEFVIEILGIGLIQYFYSTLKLLEFACSCLVRPLQLSMIVESSGRVDNIFEGDPIIMYVKTLLLMRAARIYVFLVAIIPKLLDLIDKRMDEDLFDLYDVGKAYLIAQEQVMKLLEHLVTNAEVYAEIMKILEADRQIVSNILGLVKCDRTTIATTNKTNHAICHVVNTMNDLIIKMKDDDLLDLYAARSLFAELEEVKSKVRSVNVVKPLEPNLLLAEIPWLKNESATVEFLLTHGRRSSYSKGELIINQGDANFGLVILIEGLVRTTYIPSVTALELNSRYGALPNYDFFNNLKFDAVQEDYVTSSSVIGEIGVATNREYNMRAVCLTSVELMWIPGRILNAIINQSRDSVVYQCSLWKAISVKISLNVLQDIPYFRGWTREKLLLYLQCGVVPVLKGVTVVTLNEHVSDVILIEGIAMDYKTSMTFVGPYYIPRIVGSLLLPGSPLMDRTTTIETRLFVIPNIESDAEDLSGPDGLFKDFLKKTEKEVDEIGLKGSARSIKEFPVDCKKGNRKDHMSAHEKKRMKKLRRLLKAVKFVDHIPTVKGPIEGLPSSAAFVYQQENKELTVAEHPKKKYYDPTYNYIGDVEETSESRGIKKADEEDELAEGKKFRRSTAKRSRTSILSDLSTSHIDIGDSVISTQGRENLVILDTVDEMRDKENTKEVQTIVSMKEREESNSTDSIEDD